MQGQQLALQALTAAEDPSGLRSLAQSSGCQEPGPWVFSLPMAGKVAGQRQQAGGAEAQRGAAGQRHRAKPGRARSADCRLVLSSCPLGPEKCSQREESEAPGYAVISTWVPGLGAQSGAGPPSLSHWSCTQDPGKPRVLGGLETVGRARVPSSHVGPSEWMGGCTEAGPV